MCWQPAQDLQTLGDSFEFHAKFMVESFSQFTVQILSQATQSPLQIADKSNPSEAQNSKVLDMAIV